MTTIAIVDDAPLNLQVYERILQQIAEVQIKSFSSSMVALQWISENDLDLLITDFRMPALNGLELVELFRATPGKNDIPVVMITSTRDKEVRYQALKLGVDDFLEKPADPVEFLVRARNLLKLRDRSRKLADRAEWLAEEVRRATSAIVSREQETIHRLTRATEYRDNETKNHIVRMGHYARLLGAAMGLSTERQELLFLAAPMHDVGKVAIPDRILLKAGKLTPEEWEIMKTHALKGYEILKGSDSVLVRLGAEIAAAHHEKFDGSGYPNGLAGEAIPLAGRICAVADVFDALMSVRPYKPAWSLPDTIEALKRGRGSHFDPPLVDAFLDKMPEVQKIRNLFSDTIAA